MSLITISNLGKSYDPDDIFSSISVTIPRRARIGLVGPNGVGKTTLLRILVGEEEPSEGSVYRARGIRIAYLPQETMIDSPRTVWDECLQPFNDLLKMQDELRELEVAMGDSQQVDEALEVYGRKQEEFEMLGGYAYETRIRQTLSGLGFDGAELHRPMSQLSGGQRTRALLGKLLLSDPDLLLLDEPTNHLDIAAIEWLENYLNDWEGALVCVSHDRYFLDQVVSLIWEMTPAMEVYRGNYTAYVLQRAERYKRRLGEFKKQQAFIEKEEEFIRRNIAGQKTRQAQGRRKRLERLLEEARLSAPVKEPRRLRLQLKPTGRSGDLVLRTREVSIGYADEGKALFSIPDLLLKRGECAAIIGPNGVGKTSFLKTLVEQIPPFSGEVVLGASLEIGYFVQAHEDLHMEWTLMEEIEAKAPGMLPAEIRHYLARFLFTGDDVFKQVSMLSGGERGKLALACLALSNANLLLLDEPTNHLDLPSQEVLQGILSDFAGTIMLVSHDRYLVDALATQVWEVMPSERKLRVFDGSYSEYRETLRTEAARQTVEGGTGEGKAKRGRDTKQKSTMREERRRKKRRDVLEVEIADLEARLESLSQELENPPDDIEEVRRLGQEYQDRQRLLEESLEEWSSL